MKILLNKSNFFHNLSTINKKFSDIAIVLKDNAYGHGLKEISLLSKEYGLKKAVVRTIEEAEEIKDLFDFILILSDNKFIYRNNYYFSINSISKLKQIPKNIKFHLKINTGMNRNGINIDEIPLAKKIIKEKKLLLKGIFTHHSCSECNNNKFNLQNSIFQEIKKEFIEFDILTHSLNTAGANRIDKKDFNDDFIRVGIGAYGYNLAYNKFKGFRLKPVLSLWADKICSREIKKGDSVGYDDSFIAKSNMKISTYDIGYGDGFFRIENYKTPKGYNLLGKVSMDNVVFDSIDDTICIFEDANELAKLHNTIVYEILVALKPYIKREICI